MRIIPRAGCLFILVAFTGLAIPAAAQPPAATPAAGGPRVPSPSGFAVQPWVSLSQGPSLIREPSDRQMDLAAREDETYVTVYAHKKAPELGAGRRIDGDEAGYSDAATPWDLPVAPPTNCSNSAYQTIGGQPANGADLMGALARPC
jgi:hypothetical protein